MPKKSTITHPYNRNKRERGAYCVRITRVQRWAWWEALLSIKQRYKLFSQFLQPSHCYEYLQLKKINGVSKRNRTQMPYYVMEPVGTFECNNRNNKDPLSTSMNEEEEEEEEKGDWISRFHVEFKVLCVCGVVVLCCVVMVESEKGKDWVREVQGFVSVLVDLQYLLRLFIFTVLLLTNLVTVIHMYTQNFISSYVLFFR